MFEDEAGFGRINKPKRCWCKKGVRPITPCHHIREYRYAFGAVSPEDGKSFFLVMPNCDTICMNIFLDELSKKFPEDLIMLAADNAGWHHSKTLEIPDNIVIFPLWQPLLRFNESCQFSFYSVFFVFRQPKNLILA